MLGAMNEDDHHIQVSGSSSAEVLVYCRKSFPKRLPDAYRIGASLNLNIVLHETHGGTFRLSADVQRGELTDQ